MNPKLSAFLCFILSIHGGWAQLPDSPVELFTLEPGGGDTARSLPNANDIAHAAFMTMSLDDLAATRATDADVLTLNLPVPNEDVVQGSEVLEFELTN